MAKWKELNRTEHDNLFTATNNISMNYRVYCNASEYKKTVLFLYGFDGSIEMCQLLTGFLSSDYRVIIVDYPGHCYSPICNRDYLLDELSDSINELLDFIGTERVVLWGYSFGGIISLNFYEKFSDRVESYIFQHSSTNFSPNLFKKIFYGYYLIFLYLNFKITINYLSIPLLKDKFFTKELSKLAKVITMYNDKKSVINLFKKIIFNNFDNILKLIKCPILVIGSEVDFLVSVKETKRIFNLIKSEKQIMIYKDIGHLSIVSSPETIYNDVKIFINNN